LKKGATTSRLANQVWERAHAAKAPTFDQIRQLYPTHQAGSRLFKIQSTSLSWLQIFETQMASQLMSQCCYKVATNEMEERALQA
jgi:hypothetical protein